MSVTWCTVTDAEEQKCLDLAGNAAAKNLRGKLQCTRGLNPTDCMLKIKVSDTGMNHGTVINCSDRLQSAYYLEILPFISNRLC